MGQYPGYINNPHCARGDPGLQRAKSRGCADLGRAAGASCSGARELREEQGAHTVTRPRCHAKLSLSGRVPECLGVEGSCGNKPCYLLVEVEVWAWGQRKEGSLG